ncbi:hypothetical protein HK098_006756 [Nowakowskiella sp. JEL0407]|nr:hypothetical protein HK098_006756 [Nowakowskiella sp. JEL0407]
MNSISIVVFISGSGSNLQALIDAAIASQFPSSSIALVVSNKKSAYGLQRASNANIPTLVFPLKPFRDAGRSRIEYDLELSDTVAKTLGSQLDVGNKVYPDIVVLAGWMHILSAEFLNSFPKSTHFINLHPALPGAFDGAHAIERAFEAYKQGLIKNTGVMVHKVIPEVDRGEVIIKEEVPIYDTDTLETLEERIHKLEHVLIVKATKILLEDKLNGRS